MDWDLASDITLPVRISALAVAVSSLAMIYARRSSQTAARALAITTRDFDDRHARLSIYLEDGVLWTDGGDQLAGFLCVVTNSATNASTIGRIELHVGRRNVDDAIAAPLLLRPTIRALPGSIQNHACDTPLNLAARTSHSGWWVFKLPQSVSGYWFDSFELVMTDSAGVEISCHQHLMRSIDDEN